jgi:hypothetical protein
MSQNAAPQAKDVGSVRTLTLNRSERRDALDTALARSLLQGLHAADQDESAGAVLTNSPCTAMRETNHLFISLASLPLPDALRVARATVRAREAYAAAAPQ